MHIHPTLVYRVVDYRRAALLAEAEATSWAVTPAARTRRWRRDRLLRRLVESTADILTRIIDDFEPTPEPLFGKAD